MFDATEDEVRALVIGKDGALYAAALSAAAVSDAAVVASSRDVDDSGERSERQDQCAARPVAGAPRSTASCRTVSRPRYGRRRSRSSYALQA